MKVLHIITQLDLGGAQKNVLDIVRLLDKNRYKIYFVSSNRGVLVKEAIDASGVKTILITSLKRPINPLADLITLFRLTLLFKKEDIDLVHTHSSKAGILGRWAARFANVPIILHTIHGWGFHNWQNPLTRRFFIFLERITAKITDKLIAVSQNDIERGLEAGIGTQDKYILIRYGIPIQEFTNCKVDIKKKKEELGLKTDSKVVGMVACFKPQKAPQDFLKLATIVKRNFPETKFLLVGDGVLRKKLEDLRNRFSLKDDLLFTGWRRDIPQIMSILDVLVLTSLWEGSPIVLLEAMACALPIIATSTGGAQETVQNGINGFLVSSGDVQTMAQRISELLQSKVLARRMGQQGRKLLDNSFELNYMVGRIDNLYENLAEKNKLC